MEFNSSQFWSWLAFAATVATTLRAAQNIILWLWHTHLGPSFQKSSKLTSSVAATTSQRGCILICWTDASGNDVVVPVLCNRENPDDEVMLQPGYDPTTTEASHVIVERARSMFWEHQPWWKRHCPFMDIYEAKEVDFKYQNPNSSISSLMYPCAIKTWPIDITTKTSEIQASQARLKQRLHPGQNELSNTEFAYSGLDPDGVYNAISTDSEDLIELNLKMLMLQTPQWTAAMIQANPDVCYNILKGPICQVDGYPGLIHRLSEDEAAVQYHKGYDHLRGIHVKTGIQRGLLLRTIYPLMMNTTILLINFTVLQGKWWNRLWKFYLVTCVMQVIGWFRQILQQRALKKLLKQMETEEKQEQMSSVPQ